MHWLMRIAVILVLVGTIFNASTQAKLSLYEPLGSSSQITAKATKLRECRIERLSPEAPTDIVGPAVLPAPRRERAAPPESQTLEIPRPAPIPRAHEFRPPPVSA